METARALHRVDKQLVAAQEDDPWRTGPAMRDPAGMKRKQAGGRLPAPAALHDEEAGRGEAPGTSCTA